MKRERTQTERIKTRRTQTPARLVHYENLHHHNALLSLKRPAFLDAAQFYNQINGEALTLSELAHRLNEAGHRTPRGKFFDAVSALKLRRKIAEVESKNQTT
jgi:hypothetical protein